MAGHVPTSNLNDFYSNTTSGTPASPTIIDAAIADIVSTVNGNHDFVSGLISAGTLSRIGVYNLADYGVGDGTTNDYAAINTLLTTIASTPATILINETFRIGSNITFPSNITLWFVQGGMLKPDTGITVTINGPIDAGVFQIFDGAGTIVPSHAKNTVGYPEYWGCPVNGAGDCLPALQACIEAFPITQLQRADYAISDTLRIQTPHRTLRGVDEYWSDANENKGTRIVVTSPTADVIFVGLDSNPGNANDFLKQTRIEHLLVTRSLPVTPPASGQEAIGAAGIRFNYTLYTYIDHVRSHENTLGYVLEGTVRTEFTKCAAFRSIAGNTTTNDIYYGWFLNGSINIGLAGGNASTYFTDCTSSVGGSPALSDSIGFALLFKPVDTFMLRPETTSCRTGIMITGDSSTSGNADIHIINPIVDLFTDHGVYISGVGNYGVIDISNGYFAPVSGSNTGFGMRVQDSTGMVALTNNQVVGHPNTLTLALWIENSSGVVAKNNMYLGLLRPIALINSDNCVVEDICNNPEQVATQGAVYLSDCNRISVATVVKGMAGAFPIGIQLVGVNNNFNELNCTGIDSACITGLASNKLVINGSQITTTGLSGNNLVAGVMA